MSVLLETPSDMHRIASHLRSSAADVRERARLLALSADTTRWYSPAAREFRDQVRHVARQMYGAADRLDHAAACLDRHARRVSDLLSAPVRAAASVGHLVGL